MKNYSIPTLFSVITLLCALTPTNADASPCERDEWYSPKYDACFEIRGECEQYDETDHKTCNTSRDKMLCDWLPEQDRCIPEDHDERECDSDEWYSKEYDMCFEKRGSCDQYDDTDHKTCSTRKDKMKCEWDRKKRECNEKRRCAKDEWYSKKYDRCFEKSGSCNQYDDTDSKTCNSSKDSMRCDWDSRNRSCYEENL